MAHRFLSYEKSDQAPVKVEDQVLFGDREDVKLKWVGKEPEKSEGGTICYTRTHSVKAVPGKYHHAVLTLVFPDHRKPERTYESKYHIVHHENVDGAAVGKWLCSIDGHGDFKLENYINRYDWCEWRNFGDTDDKNVELAVKLLERESETKEERDMRYLHEGYSPHEIPDVSEDSDEDSLASVKFNESYYNQFDELDEDQIKEMEDERKEIEEENKEIREERKIRDEKVAKLCEEIKEDKPCKIFFVAVSKDGKEEIGRFKLDPRGVIEGDWYFGIRITDPEKGAFAFGFGDCFEYTECDNLEPCNGFNVPMHQFEKILQSEDE